MREDFSRRVNLSPKWKGRKNTWVPAALCEHRWLGSWDQSRALCELIYGPSYLGQLSSNSLGNRLNKTEPMRDTGLQPPAIWAHVGFGLVSTLRKLNLNAFHLVPVQFAQTVHSLSSYTSDVTCLACLVSAGFQIHNLTQFSVAQLTFCGATV